MVCGLEGGLSLNAGGHWGGGAVPPNWVKATQHITIGMHEGLVASVQDDLTPPPCHSFCIQQPVEIVQDKAGAFYAYGPYRKSKLKRTCFSDLSGTLPNIVGKPFETASASFDAPVSHGKTVALRSHFMWANAHATETEVISVHTSLPQRFVMDVGRGSEGSAPFTFKGQLHYPARAPKLPHVNLCDGAGRPACHALHSGVIRQGRRESPRAQGAVAVKVLPAMQLSLGRPPTGV